MPHFWISLELTQERTVLVGLVLKGGSNEGSGSKYCRWVEGFACVSVCWIPLMLSHSGLCLVLT